MVSLTAQEITELVTLAKSIDNEIILQVEPTSLNPTAAAEAAYAAGNRVANIVSTLLSEQISNLKITESLTKIETHLNLIESHLNSFDDHYELYTDGDVIGFLETESITFTHLINVIDPNTGQVIDQTGGALEGITAEIVSNTTNRIVIKNPSAKINISLFDEDNSVINIVGSSSLSTLQITRIKPIENLGGEIAEFNQQADIQNLVLTYDPEVEIPNFTKYEKVFGSIDGEAHVLKVQEYTLIPNSIVLQVYDVRHKFIVNETISKTVDGVEIVGTISDIIHENNVGTSTGGGGASTLTDAALYKLYINDGEILDDSNTVSAAEQTQAAAVARDYADKLRAL